MEQPPQISPLSPDSPLTPEHMQAISQAGQRAKKLRSAAGVALFNGICLAVFSVLSLVFAGGVAIAGEFEWVALIMGIGLGLISWNEFRGRKLLQEFNTQAPAVLGWNQLALMGLIVAYGAWMMGVGLLGADAHEDTMMNEPELRQMFGDIGSLHKMLVVMIYGGLIAASLIFQGLNSLYYFTRKRMLQDYLAETPAWVVQFQRHQATGR